MKRLNAVISAVVFLFFTGCSSYPHQSWLEDKSLDKIADDRASEIVTVLENGDQAAIRSMFSNQALNETEELDDTILPVIARVQQQISKKVLCKEFYRKNCDIAIVKLELLLFVHKIL